MLVSRGASNEKCERFSKKKVEEFHRLYTQYLLYYWDRSEQYFSFHFNLKEKK